MSRHEWPLEPAEHRARALHEHHLRKVFSKLDISSRNQLDRALPDAAERIA